MLVTLVANVVNIVVSYGLIFGALGMPQLGVVGSAWGTFIARLFGFCLLLYFMWRGVNGVSIRGRMGWKPEFATARQILRIGVPAATEQVLISTAFLSLSIVVAQLGTVALAAHRVTINAMSISFLPGFGFGMATTALVGQSIGARRFDEAEKITAIAMRWAMLWMAPLGAVFFFLGEPILRIFTDDPTVIAQGTAALKPVAFTQAFWAIGAVVSGALRGTGNTKYPMRINTASMWGIVLIAAVTTNIFLPSLALIWAGFLVTAPLSSYLIWQRWKLTIRAAQVDPDSVPAAVEPTSLPHKGA
jgi:multidrug resistance protein, MATE family